MTSTVAEDKTGGVSAKPKRHSPVFLAVFAVFLVTTSICVAGTVIGVAAAHLGNHDTRWYWAGGQLLSHGGNPYDQAAVGRVQRAVGIRSIGNDVVRNPPPALSLVLPLGWVGPRAAVPVWSLLMTACLGVSILMLSAMLGEVRERYYFWIAWCFAPALCCAEMGQTGVVLLLGLAVFLRFYEERPFWAGAALSLCAIKPHIFLPFGLVLLVWIVLRRKWPVVVGAVAAAALESVIVMGFDPRVWTHYSTAMQTQGFEGLHVPTLGVELRFAVDPKAMWLEFVPAGLGCAWALWYFWRNRQKWDWRTHGALLTLVSLVVAPYSWFTDQVIALPAILFVLAGARQPRRGSLTLLLAVMSAGALEMMISKSTYFELFLWQGIAWLAWYLYAKSGRASGQEPLTSAGLAKA